MNIILRNYDKITVKGLVGQAAHKVRSRSKNDVVQGNYDIKHGVILKDDKHDAQYGIMI